MRKRLFRITLIALLAAFCGTWAQAQYKFTPKKSTGFQTKKSTSFGSNKSSFSRKKSGFSSGSSSGSRGNLVVNGSFDDPEEPLKGWWVDWAWTKSTNLTGGKNTFLPEHQGHKSVMLCQRDGVEEWNEIAFGTPLIEYDSTKQYHISFDCRGDKKPVTCIRMYVKGFKFKSGVRPYETPHLSDLTLANKGMGIMLKSGPQPDTVSTSTIPEKWIHVTAVYPRIKYGDKSPTMQKAVAKIKYIQLYCVLVAEYGHRTQNLYIDNMKIVAK